MAIAAAIAGSAIRQVFALDAPLRSDTPLAAVGWRPEAWPALVLAVRADAGQLGMTCDLMDQDLVGVASFGDLVAAMARVLRSAP